tara:strand:- start:318 stop:19061 length:18744 start_codon:yes stop_codon:yes gene_type:complete
VVLARNGNDMRKSKFFEWMRGKSALKQATSIVTAAAISVLQVVPAAAQVVAAGGTGTSVTPAGAGINTVTTTDTIAGGGIALGSFTQFNVASGQTINLIQPTATNAMINVVNDATGAPTTVNGTLSISHADAGSQSNVFFLDSNGFVVGSGGVINAQKLTLSTAQQSVGQAILGGDISATASVLAGTEELSGADINVAAGGQINAANLTMRAGARMVLAGNVTVDSDAVGAGTAPVAVNTDALTVAAAAVVQDGVIRFTAGNVDISGKVKSDGGDAVIAATDKVTVEETAEISTREIANLDTGDHATDNSTGVSGDLIVAAQDIEIKNGAEIYATGTNAFDGGLIALLARDVASDTAWPFAPTNYEAKITINGATIRGGSVVVTAVAVNANVVNAADASEEDEIAAYEADAAANENTIDAFFTGLGDKVIGFLEGGVDILKTSIPVDVRVMDAKATITITNSTLIADGNWKGNALTVTDDYTGDKEAKGLFKSTNELLEGELAIKYLTGATDPSLYKATLPVAFNPSEDSLYIQTHAANEVTIAPIGFALGVGVAVTDTQSQTKISGSTLTSNAGNIEIRSTLAEKTNITISPSAIAGISVSTIVTVRDAVNQLLVDGGSTTSAGALSMDAMTAKTTSLTQIANAGVEGKAAIALMVDVGSSFTEAALGGSVVANGDVTVDAETLYFGKSQSSTATMGLKSLNSAILARTPVGTVKDKAVAGAKDVWNKIRGNETTSHEPPEPDKDPGFGFGLSINVGVEDDDTFATLGGQYRDLGNDRALTSLAATPVNAGTGAVNVNATYRFALTSEGGTRLKRDTLAKMGSIGLALKAKLAAANAALASQGKDPITQEELIQQFGNAAFLSAGVGLIGGETQAEVGANANITQATGLNVNATTAYPANPVTEILNLVTEMETWLADMRDFQLLEDGDDDSIIPSANTPPELPNLMQYLDPRNYVTTQSAAKAEQPTAATPPDAPEDTTASAQGLAVAVTINYFQTDNDTKAVIRDGAQISLTSGNVNVNALQTSFFYNTTNLPLIVPTGNPLSANENVNNAVGGGASVNRIVSDVTAIIESGAVVSTANGGDVNVDAKTQNLTFTTVYAGGSAKAVAVNAALGSTVLENSTIAQIGDSAVITADAILIDAKDDSIVFGLAGAFGGAGSTEVGKPSGSVAVGVSVYVNFVKRNVYAGIGTQGTAAKVDLADNTTTITANSLTINAINDALEVGVTVAGARVSTNPGSDAESVDPDGASNQKDQDDDDTIIPSWLFADDENSALDVQKNRGTGQADSSGDMQGDADSAGDKQKTGWAVAGAAVLNLKLNNATTAEIVTDGIIDVNNAVSVLARNESLSVAGAGAVSAATGTNPNADQNALAGAFAIVVDSRDVKTNIDAAEIQAGSVKISTEDLSKTIDVSVGGAGSSKGKIALAGSVSVNVATGETTTQINNTVISAGSGAIDIDTKDESLTIAVGGGVGVNMKTDGGAGVGIGIAVSVVERPATTRVIGTSSLNGGAIDAYTQAIGEIYSVGLSVGAGRTGVAGTISVNILLGGAKTIIGNADSADGLVALKATSLSVKAKDDYDIWSLAGAVGLSRDGTALGGAITVNVIISDTQAVVRNATVDELDVAADDDVTDDLGTVVVNGDSDSIIGTLAVAGAVSGSGTAIGVGLSGNNITASNKAAITNSTVTDADSVMVKAVNKREIKSLGGGVAGSNGSTAAGFSATVNVLSSNDSLVDLSGSTITTDVGGITGQTLADAKIGSIAAAISASNGGAAIGGAATVNVTTATNQVKADNAILTSATGITLDADDTSTINSLSGGVAISIGSTGVGAAISANVLAHDTNVSANNSTFTSNGGAISLTADNDAEINSLAAGFAGSTGTAVSGSTAVGYIGNDTRVTSSGTQFTSGVDGNRQDILLKSNKTSEINILAGSVAIGTGGAGVGAAVTVAIIHDTVTTDLIATNALIGKDLTVEAINNSGDISGSALRDRDDGFYKDGGINAIAVSAGGGSSVGFAGSLVYAQIGKPPSDVAALPNQNKADADDEDYAADANTEAETERDNAFEAVRTRTGESGLAFSLDEDDITRAAVQLGTAGATLDTITVRSTESSSIETLAGAFGAGGTAGIGAAINVNLLFGQTIAAMSIADEQTSNVSGNVLVQANQSGSIRTLAASLGAGGTAGVAGSIVVNVFDRKIQGLITSTVDDGDADVTVLNTDGGDVTVDVNQSGLIEAFAGAVGAGGTAGVGVAFTISVQGDDASATVENVQINTAKTTPISASNLLADAGNISITANNEIDIDAIAVSLGGAGTVGVGGSFAISVAESTVKTIVKRAVLTARDVTLTSGAANTLNAYGGSVAGGGAAAVGIGIATNVSSLTVITDIDATAVRAGRNIIAQSDATTGMGNVAISGAVAGGVSVAGTGAANIAENVVTTTVRNSSGVPTRIYDVPFDAGTGTANEFGGSDLVARGSVMVTARGETTISVKGGKEEDPTVADSSTGSETPAISVSFSGGGTAGIGASVSVNKTANVITTNVSGQSRVVGLGYDALSVVRNDGTAQNIRGVYANAFAKTVTKMVSANGAAGGLAGVSAMFNFNIVDDKAEVNIGDGTLGGVGSINGILSSTNGNEFLVFGSITNANSLQDSILDAEVENSVDAFALTIGVGGTAGVGAASATNIIKSKAKINVNIGQVFARNDVIMESDVDTILRNYVIGVGGGFVGASASVGVNIFTTEALVNLTGANISGGIGATNSGNVFITTNATNSTFSFVGGLSGGVVGASGGFLVNVLDSTSAVNIASTTELSGAGDTGKSQINATGALAINALSNTTTENFAVSGSGGGVAIALAANINLITTTTTITSTANQSFASGGDTTMIANETANIEGTGGSVAVGGAGFGASLDYVNFAATTGVTLGASTAISSGGNVTIDVDSFRTVASNVVTGAGGSWAGISGSISVIEMGGAAESDSAEEQTEQNARLADVNTALQEDQDSGGSNDDSTAGDLTAYAGGSSVKSDVETSRKAVSVTGTAAVDNIGVSIGNNSSIQAGITEIGTGNINSLGRSDITIDATAKNKVSHFSGSLAVGMVSGNVSVVVGTLSSDVGVTIGDNTNLNADGTISIKALSTRPSDADSLSATAIAMGGGLFGVNAGTVVSKISSEAVVTIGQGVDISGIYRDRALAINIDASREDRVTTKIENALVSLAVGVGSTIAIAKNEGLAEVRIGDAATASSLRGDTVTIQVQDKTRTTVEAFSAAGGLLGTGNGVDADAQNNGRANLILTRTGINASSLNMNNIASGIASADARGVTVAGGVAIGVSLAKAKLSTSMTTTISNGGYGDAQISADTVNIVTELNNSNGTSNNVTSFAKSSGGGLLSGNGASAKAYLDYTVATVISGNIFGATSVDIATNANAPKASAKGEGKSGGVAVIGVTSAVAGQSAGKTATVSTTYEQGNLDSFGTITVQTNNAPFMKSTVESGTGGLLVGSGGVADVNVRVSSQTSLGTLGILNVTTPGELNIGAGSLPKVASLLDNTSGSLIGASGATTSTDITTTSTTLVGGGARIMARNINISASNGARREDNAEGYNIKSTSGGAIDVPAMISDIEITANTYLTVADNAVISQVGDPLDVDDLQFNIGITTNFYVRDELNLDAGGAVAAPIGESDINIKANNAIVSIQNADILSVGLVNIYTGGDADIYNFVDATSYGLAGAAVANAYATYNAVNKIEILNGANVESENDIALKAGHTKTGLQSVKVHTESRTYNKTAIPIPITPDADALAVTTSLVDIKEGSNVRAVRDVYLFAEGGNRDILGYGRGKDLYREAAAAIGSFFSNAVGGDDVSLDIESGTSVDRSNNDGILVNGTVRAGAKNKQVFFIDQFGVLNNDLHPSGEYTNEMREDITTTYETGISIVQELQGRIDVLEGYLSNAYLTDSSLDLYDPSDSSIRVGSADKARAAWISEIGFLQIRQAASAGRVVNKYTFGDIRAVEGNIDMRADYVQGMNTGLLHAPGDALILINVLDGSMVETNLLNIPTQEGGLIFLNDQRVENTTEVQVQSGFKAGPYAFNMISGADAAPRIEVVTNIPAAQTGDGGYIVVAGEVSNLRGRVDIIANADSIDLRADISAETINIDAAGDITVGYIPGIRNVGGSPEGQYANFFKTTQERLRWRAIRDANPSYNVTTLEKTSVSGFSLKPTEGKIRAGKNVYISADKLNINGLIQAGTGSFSVDILSGIDTQIAGLRGKSSGTILLHDTAYPDAVRSAKSDYIRVRDTDGEYLGEAGYEDFKRDPNFNNVKVYYNYDTDQIEIDNLVVQGGEVRITGDITSTGSGRIEALDGYGRVNIDSAAMTPVVIQRIDLGQTSGDALAGLVSIQDTSTRVDPGNNASPFLLTEFVREGGQMKIYNNTCTVQAGCLGNFNNQTIILNPEAAVADQKTLTLLKPGRLVSTLGSGGNAASRSTQYQPKVGRDWVYLTAEESIRTVEKIRKELIVIGITGSSTDKVIYDDLSTVDTTASLGSAPYIGDDLSGSDYAYAFEAEGKSYNFDKTAEVKTHDSVKWWKLGSGWRHYEWTETTTTTQLYTHRLKADYPIEIVFRGNDSASIDIQSAGDVILSRTIINGLGNTNITSTNGDIFTASKQVRLLTDDTVLTANNGSIYGLNGAFRLDQTETGTLSVSAADLINVRELSGNMNLLSAVTSTRPGSDDTASPGNISLVSAGGIIDNNTGTDATIQGTSITLEAQGGDIKSNNASSPQMKIDQDETGALTAYATGDIVIEEIAGDLAVNKIAGVKTDVSTGTVNGAASVRLIATNGAILDRNDVESKDIRTRNQLLALWGEESGLYDEGGSTRVLKREGDQVSAKEAERNALYEQYWTARDADSGNAQTYNLSVDEQNYLANGIKDPTTGVFIGTWTQDQFDTYVNAYVAEREALYTDWNGQTTKRTDFNNRSLYDAYWDARTADSGNTQVFALDPNYENSLRKTWTDQMVDEGTINARIIALVNDGTALYATWNSETEKDDLFTVNITTAELGDLTEGSSWSQDELTRSIRAGLIRKTGDTVTRNEDANISSIGDIVLESNTGIGEILDDYVVDADGDNRLSLTDLEKIATSEFAQFTIPETSTGDITIVQSEDVNFDFRADVTTGDFANLTATATTGDIFLGSKTGASIRRVRSLSDIILKADGNLSDSRLSGDATAITGKIIVLEAGNNGFIGTELNPMTMEILTDGTITARAGKSVFIENPIGALPVVEVFAGDIASLTAFTTITDEVGSGFVRISGDSVWLDAGEIGTSTVPFGVEINDTVNGTVRITTRATGGTSGNAYLRAGSDWRLEYADIYAGGEIDMTGVTLAGTADYKLTLVDTNAARQTVKFGTASSLLINAKAGIDHTESVGTDFAGGNLEIVTDQVFGLEADRIMTQLVGFKFSTNTPISNASAVPAVVTGDTSIWLRELDDLVVSTIEQNDNVNSEVDIETVANLAAGTITSNANVRLDAGNNIQSGTINTGTTNTLARVELDADKGIGTDSRVIVTTSNFQSAAVDGDTNLEFRNATTGIDFITSGGAGNIDVLGTNAALILNANKGGIATNGGSIDMLLGNVANAIGLTLNEDVISLGGSITIDTVKSISVAEGKLVSSRKADGTGAGDVSIDTENTLMAANTVSVLTDTGAITIKAGLDLNAGDNFVAQAATGNIAVMTGRNALLGDTALIKSDLGTIALDVDGDATFGADARIVTANATNTALRVLIDGTLDTGAHTSPVFEANEVGALSTFRLGAMADTRFDTVLVKLAELDAIIATGDAHFEEVDSLILTNLEATSGNVDLLAKGDITLRSVKALGGGETLTVSSETGSIFGDTPIVEGALIKLFAFGGSIGGLGGGSFATDTPDDAELWLVANQNIDYTETAGDLKLAFANAANGDLTLNIPGGALNAGFLGADGTITISSLNNITVNVVGASEADIADEVALQLADRVPTLFGTVILADPDVIDFTALTAGSTIQVGLANVEIDAILRADNLDANIYDPTANDGLGLVLTDATGDFTDTVDVDVIADGGDVTLPTVFTDVRPLLTSRTIGALQIENPAVSEDGSPLGTSNSIVTIKEARLGSGEITTNGPELIAQDVLLSGDFWFRQGLFDLLGTIEFVELSIIADTQLLSTEEDRLSFELRDEIELVTNTLMDPTRPETTLTLNRRLEGVSVNGGQGFVFEVGSETQIIVNDFLKGESAGGVVAPLNLEDFDADDNDLTNLPFMISKLGDQAGADGRL